MLLAAWEKILGIPSLTALALCSNFCIALGFAVAQKILLFHYAKGCKYIFLTFDNGMSNILKRQVIKNASIILAACFLSSSTVCYFYRFFVLGEFLCFEIRMLGG